MSKWFAIENRNYTSVVKAIKRDYACESSVKLKAVRSYNFRSTCFGIDELCNSFNWVLNNISNIEKKLDTSKIEAIENLIRIDGHNRVYKWHV